VLTSRIFTSNHGNNWTQFGPDFPGLYGTTLAKVGSFLYANSASGGVYRIPFSDDETVLYAEAIQDVKDTELSMPIKVNSFTEILSAQFSLTWDPSVVTFVGTEQYGLQGIDNSSFGVTQVDKGKLVFSWSDPTLQPKSLSNASTLFAVKFKLTGSPGSSSGILISDEVISIEIIDSDYREKDFKTISGVITISTGAMLSGVIKHFQSGVADAVITATAGNSLDVLINSSDQLGNYKLALPPSPSYKLSVKKANGAYLDYLNEADVARIRRHILQTSLITDPYVKIAADVNESKSITTLDILHLESVLLGQKNELPGGHQWKFVPTDFSFTISDPFSYPPTRTILNTSSNITQDFVAIHLGDVVDSQNTDGRIALHDAILKIDLSDIDESGEVTAVARTYGFTNTSAFQISLEWDELIEFVDFESHIIQPRTNHSDNAIRILWDEDAGRDKKIEDASILFSLRFKVNGDKNLLEKTLKLSKVFNTQIYNQYLQAEDLTMEMLGETYHSDIGNPHPNPFTDEIIIPITLQKSSLVEITLLDVTGKKLSHSRMQGETGINQVVWKTTTDYGRELAAGFYLMRIQGEGIFKTVKVIKE
jgi:hypothetical protein